ncbi:hypothetical protein N7G274_000282 [Stereocaulon virgatum]|uniref:Uncharacterized protein n=1 Tax=Stereocaulon virgatum TaxID=373712 RepID=A0ABR4AS32_9LECA
MLGLEAYVEASHLGRTVYESHGYVVMHIAERNFENVSSEKDWVRLVKDLQTKPVAVTWRPAGGRYVKGETVVSWEAQPRSKLTEGRIGLGFRRSALINTERDLHL